MQNTNTRRGFTQNVVSVPLCGESVAVATKEGQNKEYTLWPLLHRLTAVLPPQGREMSRAFTLIELLVVVLIIGILAAVAIPQYQKAVEKSRLTEALIQLNAMQKDIDLYLLEHGFPEEHTVLQGQGTIEETFPLYHHKTCSSDSCEIQLDSSNLMLDVCLGDAGPCGALTDTTTTKWGYLCAYKNSLGKSLCESLPDQEWVVVDYNEL